MAMTLSGVKTLKTVLAMTKHLIHQRKSRKKQRKKTAQNDNHKTRRQQHIGKHHCSTSPMQLSMPELPYLSTIASINLSYTGLKRIRFMHLCFPSWGKRVALLGHIYTLPYSNVVMCYVILWCAKAT